MVRILPDVLICTQTNSPTENTWRFAVGSCCCANQREHMIDRQTNQDVTDWITAKEAAELTRHTSCLPKTQMYKGIP